MLPWFISDSFNLHVINGVSKNWNMKTRFILQGLVAALSVLLLNSGCMIADSLSGMTQVRELRKTGQPAKTGEGHDPKNLGQRDHHQRRSRCVAGGGGASREGSRIPGKDEVPDLATGCAPIPARLFDSRAV